MFSDEASPASRQPAVELDPEIAYQRELIGDSARHTERFELLVALAAGPDPVPPVRRRRFFA